MRPSPGGQSGIIESKFAGLNTPHKNKLTAVCTSKAWSHLTHVLIVACDLATFPLVDNLSASKK